MGRLTLVRHGQTMGEWYDRDRLSEPGTRQAARLGEHLVSVGRQPTAVYVGPRRRHQQTHEAVVRAYEARGHVLPQPVTLDALDEYAAESLFRVLLPRLAERDAEVKAVLEAGSLEGPAGERRLFRLLDRVGRAWVRGELEDEAVEGWAAFVSRVGTALERMTQGAGKGADVLAFTSAGPVAAATGWVLGAEGERVFGLSLAVKNTACSDFLFSSGRLSLQAFNGTAHLLDSGLETLR